jgi:RNA polymerase sigma-70 factor, ECF subfamily
MRAAQDNRSDHILLQAYRRGDAQAFTLLVRRYQSNLFTFIKRMVRDHNTAEDLFQETFLRVMHNLDSYRENGKFQAWLFGIARNLCIDHARKKRWLPILPDEGALSCEEDVLSGYADGNSLPDALLETKELEALVLDAVSGLPVFQREVFLLRQHSALPFHEIASLLNRPLGTVLSQMRSSLLSIRKHVESRYEYEPHKR